MLKRFALHSLFSAIAGLATAFASFASGVVIANLLGVDGAGIVAFVVWIALVAAPIIDGGTALSVGRFPADLKGQADEHAAETLPRALARRLALYNVLALIALVGANLMIAETASSSPISRLEHLDAGLPFDVALIGLHQMRGDLLAFRHDLVQRLVRRSGARRPERPLGSRATTSS